MARTALIQFSGHESKEINTALFIDPTGNVMGRAGDKQDEILYADIDAKACDDARDLWGFFKFRRPNAYGEILHDPT